MNLRIALFEPRIPQNTGNIARTCAAFNFPLDLICPLGFKLEDKYLKRAGLDYWQYLDIDVHQDINSFTHSTSCKRIVGFTKKSKFTLRELRFNTNDILLFGREDIGLPDEVISMCSLTCRIPMPGGADDKNLRGVRSLNLSVACGIVAYQAFIQSAD